ncbi:hypothetical protein [Roseiconus lacunae]|uniref:HPF/RaiA family ribosome-associated protein n=1 Tax=Roseiconus lacunae TaxID=2605694 RepID=A0ABT7PE48_9BACT|nr:hypothetical protein [Roseiconus lacunae]MCD0463668.1 hypothetical protein [Roseiconus lacunae]MDM4014775.1 hypothetical protein [Roseiconus lacunae]
MNVSVGIAPSPRQEVMRALITARVRSTLERFSDRISQVDVALTDENGPRGGEDMRCRIKIVMPKFKTVVTTAVESKPLAAVALAAERARRIAVSRLQRTRETRRTRILENSIFNDTPE